MPTGNKTFAIIKPDAVAAGNAGAILSLIEKNGFKVKGLRLQHLTLKEAEGFYAVHKGKGFFDELVAFMTEAPVVLLALEKENAVQSWRDLMGATNPDKAAEGTVRKLYGDQHRPERLARFRLGRECGDRAGLVLPGQRDRVVPLKTPRGGA
jgi:nucleoside-diphosphate kinase